MPTFPKSYTQWSVYKQCPAQYKYRYIEKIPVPPKPEAAARGTDIHAMVENIIEGLTNTFPRLPEVSGLLANEELMQQYEEFFVGLRAYGAVPELEFRLNHNWEKIVPVWVRGFFDVTVPLPDKKTVFIYELKSGKIYDDHIEQRNFYGLAAMGEYPWAEEVIVQGIYLDLGKNSDPTIYKTSMKATYKYMWNGRLEQIDNAASYIPHPSPSCGWCPFARDKGGPCRFSSNRDA